jgi:hypothetical protein
MQIRAGQVFTYDVTSGSSGSVEQMQLLTGSDASDAGAEILDSSISNFQRQLLLGTQDQLFEDDGFGVGPAAISFTITDKRPIAKQSDQGAHVDQLESLFQDPRLSHLPNFKFLPPVNALPPGADEDITDAKNFSYRVLGNYRMWGRVAPLRYSELQVELSRIAKAGGRHVITFDPTTRINKVIGQFFERTPSGMRKLDVIDFGVHGTGNSLSPTAHVFFAGRLLTDSVGTDTFIHLFTLVFE